MLSTKSSRFSVKYRAHAQCSLLIFSARYVVVVLHKQNSFGEKKLNSTHTIHFTTIDDYYFLYFTNSTSEEYLKCVKQFYNLYTYQTLLFLCQKCHVYVSKYSCNPCGNYTSYNNPAVVSQNMNISLNVYSEILIDFERKRNRGIVKNSNFKTFSWYKNRNKPIIACLIEENT